jgi:hypothetical protein
MDPRERERDRDEVGWQLPGAKYPFGRLMDSAPATRRSSLASNVHSLLNPIAASDEGEEDMIVNKRKRMQ